MEDTSSQESVTVSNVEDTSSQESTSVNHDEDVISQESKSSGNTFKFHGRHFKKHAPEHIIYEGPCSGRPQLSKYVENKILLMEEIIGMQFGLHFVHCVIAKKPWVLHKPGGYKETGVAVNYTFITNDGSLMWRKRGDKHGTINKVYTKNSSTYYTTWMKNPTL